MRNYRNRERDIRLIRATIVWGYHLGRCSGADAVELPPAIVATSGLNYH